MTSVSTWLIGGSIVLQLTCTDVSAFLAIRSRNGSWRFWTALTVAFLGIVLRRGAWIFDDVIGINREAVRWFSISATYMVSLAFLAAMIEAALFHHAQRAHIRSLSENIKRLEDLMGETTRG